LRYFCSGFYAFIIGFVCRAAESESVQGYTPFEGGELTARVKSTFLRSALVYDGANVSGPPLLGGICESSDAVSFRF